MAAANAARPGHLQNSNLWAGAARAGDDGLRREYQQVL